ncbi:MAG: winged helix-turn-helix domain-containing protein [Janibacter sp.]|nr:winged helix-turn-helix domain-containing protein [Janibacter sp.]
MTEISMLALPPTSTAILAHLLKSWRVHPQPATGPHIQNSDIARALGQSKTSTRSAMKPLVREGLITYHRGHVRLREDAPTLPALYDILYIAHGAPVPPDIADSGVRPAVFQMPGTVPVPYFTGARNEAMTVLCGPTLEATRRVLLEEFRAVMSFRPALRAVRRIYGWRSEHGDAGDLLDDLARAAEWLQDVTCSAALNQGRDRLTGHEWAVHDVLLDRAANAVRQFDPKAGPLADVDEGLRALRNDQPRDPEYLEWMDTYLTSRLA